MQLIDQQTRGAVTLLPRLTPLLEISSPHRSWLNTTAIEGEVKNDRGHKPPDRYI